MKMLRSIPAVLAVFLVFLGAPALAESPIYTGTFSSKAVGGYDTVTYFTTGQPVKGVDEFSSEYKGAKWLFSSAENKALFDAAPEKYAPQYGGYCAWAAAQEKLAPGDPNVWKIVDGKLYLNYDKNIAAKWEQDIPGFITKADKYYPTLVK